MFIETLGQNGQERCRVSEADCAAINDLLRQLNPKAGERTVEFIERQLEQINRNGGVAVIREKNGRIVAMGTWTVVPTLMRIEAFASEVSFDQQHPEWRRFLRELGQYIINRAKRAKAERIDLTWNQTRPGYKAFLELGFTEADTRLLRLVL
ncbi:MAG: hypothetical protein A3B37_03870 [Candidatus Sungbacteria bacterium RIFCSPLOWO2_01_FULL_59_16]|uniref:N-acetyltransferase domain-containing protein n=1 Tax=Candidatus Sungbacteria bacterium RIFCSPLOWO2_01_FULL_59_16 TaxID=1802280 RepID=A0A1G2L941_9BACT|nr:MAG: hypothetical protein A3B37_03870 [Candidatus Sungbacteria bacterium RIFCSPLOWO2_01_FULL_59_16]